MWTPAPCGPLKLIIICPHATMANWGTLQKLLGSVGMDDLKLIIPAHVTTDGSGSEAAGIPAQYRMNEIAKGNAPMMAAALSFKQDKEGDDPTAIREELTHHKSRC